jgi:hypothetical protein
MICKGVSPFCRHGLRGSGASPESEVCGRDRGFTGQMPSLAFTTARLAPRGASPLPRIWSRSPIGETQLRDR